MKGGGRGKEEQKEERGDGKKGEQTRGKREGEDWGL